jgi:hypothetical protein
MYWYVMFDQNRYKLQFLEHEQKNNAGYARITYWFISVLFYWDDELINVFILQND